MVRITLDLLRKRAEHNEGLVSTLEEVALHQQNIEKIEVLGQLCPNLKILYLQSNLISKIQNLHKLKALNYLNLAINNVTKLQNLQKCEALQKLDLTMNFIDKPGLLTVGSLVDNEHLQDLYLLGNPCADWSGYRQYVIAKLPQLKKLDGQDIKHSERIVALQLLPQLEEKLREEVRGMGIDPEQAAFVEDDSMFDENGEVKETGYVDENGELRRPWCAATRILEHREQERLNQDAEEQKKKASKDSNTPGEPTQAPRREDFPEIKEGERIFQKNEGQWDFSLEEDDGGKNLVLEVDAGKYLDTSLIKVDVQPHLIRLLIKGRLLQLLLPCEVRTDASTAQRSNATGRLQITMPKENPQEVVVDVAHIRPSKKTPSTGKADKQGSQASTMSGDFLLKEVQKATIVAAHEDDDDFIPDL